MERENTQPTTEPAVEVEFPEPGVAAVRLRGEHDLSTSKCLAEALEKATSRPNVLIDLSECTFMDSSVIAKLFRARAELSERGGRLELVIPPEATTVRRVAEVTALSSLVPVHESPTAGVAAFRPQDHTITVRDLRQRYGDEEARGAQCSCGWQGPKHIGQQTADRAARRDGATHLEVQRGGHGARPRA